MALPPPFASPRTSRRPVDGTGPGAPGWLPTRAGAGCRRRRWCQPPGPARCPAAEDCPGPRWMPERLVEKYQYPELASDIKDQILGLNAAKLFGVDPKAKRKAIKADK